MLAVIKADGYGHGSVELARQLEDKTDYFGVAVIEEAVELRRAGIKNPILILGYTSPSQDELLVKYDITQNIYTYEMAKRLSDKAAELGKTAKIHIGLDTGMSRVGFRDSDESVEIIKKIKELPNLCMEGLFSHYARADEKNKKTAFLQSERFDLFIDKLEKAGVNIPIKHLSNSAAVEELEKQFPTLLEKDSPTQRVGGNAGEKFSEVTHTVQMMSLHDSFSHSELLDFDRKVREVVQNPLYVVEPKFDGLSV